MIGRACLDAIFEAANVVAVDVNIVVSMNALVDFVFVVDGVDVIVVSVEDFGSFDVTLVYA
jgi:hypothetical protein